MKGSVRILGLDGLTPTIFTLSVPFARNGCGVAECNTHSLVDMLQHDNMPHERCAKQLLLDVRALQPCAGRQMLHATVDSATALEVWR
jgi:hypothetical protein